MHLEAQPHPGRIIRYTDAEKQLIEKARGAVAPIHHSLQYRYKNKSELGQIDCVAVIWKDPLRIDFASKSRD